MTDHTMPAPRCDPAFLATTQERGGRAATSVGDARLKALRAARAVGAVALLAVGGIHLEQYTVANFSVIPKIGTLFLLNFIAASALAVVLLVPLGSTAGRRRLQLDSVVALAGIGLSVGGLAGLLISEHTPLFGFMEHGYRLEIVVAIAAEAVAILSLGVVLALADDRR